MNNIVRFPNRQNITYRYKQGDIGRALAQGLRYEMIAADIEGALHDLLFVAEPEDVINAREMISGLLHALPD